MRRTPALAAAVLLLAILLGGSRAARAVDPFYLGLLRDGGHAYDRKDYAQAVHDLRLACFGMLDEPKPLTDCLVRLALAQDRAGDADGFRETFGRIVEVEERFSAYSQGDLAPELRAALEQRLPATIPPTTLAGVPAFRGLVPPPKQAQGQGPAPATGAGRPEVRRGPPTPEKTEKAEKTTGAPSDRPAPAGPPAPAPQTPNAPATMPAAPAVGTAAPPTNAQAPRPLSPAELEKVATVRKILDADSKTRDLKHAFQLAREVADAHSDVSDAQHLAGEAAYRLSRWQDAAHYFRRGGEPAADEPELLFYMAVAFYESGDKAAAAKALERCLPNLQRTPYVDGYAKKILGG
jgi:tetratricopeptide (TPR) repeat protein